MAPRTPERIRYAHTHHVLRACGAGLAVHVVVWPLAQDDLLANGLREWLLCGSDYDVTGFPEAGDQRALQRHLRMKLAVYQFVVATFLFASTFAASAAAARACSLTALIEGIQLYALYQSHHARIE